MCEAGQAGLQQFGANETSAAATQDFDHPDPTHLFPHAAPFTACSNIAPPFPPSPLPPHPACSVLTFEGKISAGNGEVMLSRDMARLAPRLGRCRVAGF